MSVKKPIKIRKIDLILKLHTIFVIISISSNMNKEKSLLNILVVLCNIVFNDLLEYGFMIYRKFSCS